MHQNGTRIRFYHLTTYHFLNLMFSKKKGQKVPKNEDIGVYKYPTRIQVHPISFHSSNRSFSITLSFTYSLYRKFPSSSYPHPVIPIPLFLGFLSLLPLPSFLLAFLLTCLTACLFVYLDTVISQKQPQPSRRRGGVTSGFRCFPCHRSSQFMRMP